MNIAIIGSGGVGGYFGAKLAQAGNNVTFLARGEHLNRILENGITVNSINGNFKVEQVSATDSINKIGKVDLALICVKAWQIKDIRDELKEIIKSDTIVLPIQNGVLAAEELGEVINTENIIGGLCRIISKIESPGVISHIGVKPTIVFGEFSKEKSIRLEKLKSVLEQAGIIAKISGDIESDLWKKFIAICVSGLMAVTKTTYGEMCELKETREMMVELLTEIFNLSRKLGVNIGEEFLEKTVSFMDTFPYKSTSSLTRDVWAGRPSEIEYQNGTVVKLAATCGVKTPINRFIYNSIMPMELKARGNWGK